MHYDVFVIGAGPGGYTAAIHAARRGLSVGIAEMSHPGGTCTNVGCIPTKTYAESVKLLRQTQNARRFGITTGEVSLELASLNKRASRIIARLRKGIELLLEQQQIAIHRDEACFLDPHTLRVGDDEITAGHIIVATGSRPLIPPIFAHPGVFTSDEIFSLTELPEDLLIIGGGVIGCEMANIFSALGSRITVIEALDRILPHEDEDVSRELSRLMRSVTFHTATRVSDITGQGPYTVQAEGPDGPLRLTASAILLCIGRTPQLPAGLAELGVHRTPSGGIKVDAGMRSSIPHILAVGDVTGEQPYAYTATREAEVAVRRICGEEAVMSYEHVPSVIFTHPEIASVGTLPDTGVLREGSFPVSALGRARTMETSDGWSRVWTRPDGKMARVTIMAQHATELVPWATLALEQGLTVEEFLAPIYPHPVMAELLKEAAEDVLDLCVHKP